MNKITKYLRKHTYPSGLTSERDRQKAMAKYYKSYIGAVDPAMMTPGSVTTTAATNGTNGMHLVPGPGMLPTMPPTGPIGTTSAGTTMGWDKWTKKEKEALAKVGFKFNKEKQCWELNLSTTVLVPQLEGIMAWTEEQEQGKPSDIAIKVMKRLKEQLIKKLTAKIILMELVKPHEIKE